MSSKDLRYQALVKTFHADLYRYAYWLCQHKAVADDLVQETFLRAWKHLDSLLDASSAKAWLITILRRENARRFERKQFDYQEMEQDTLVDFYSASPEQQREQAELQQLIFSLELEYREPLVLQVLFGMTGEEIANTLALNLNTVNTRLYRARHQLRELINQQTGVITMDELEFRRRIFSDPNADDISTQQAVEEHKERQQLQQQLLQQDMRIKQALQLAVPADLAERLLLNQQLDAYRQKRRHRWFYGLAASVALTLGLVQLRFEPLHFPTDLGGYALAHVYHEASALVGQSARLPLSEVNALLASFDGKLAGFEQQVRYARFCNFRGVRSLHLILDTKDGPVTVFVLPKDHGWQADQTFADDNFHGQSLVMQKADLVLVAAKNQQLQQIAGLLQQQLSFTG